MAFRNQTRDFATHAAASVDPPHAVAATLEHHRHKASELSVWRAVFGKGAIETNKKKREKRKKRHEAERTRMAVVYNCFAHLESIARFPRPVGSCVFVLARCRARHSTAQHAIDAGARGHELLRRGGARPLPDARGCAQARTRRRRRVVALRARRHGPRATHVGGPGAGRARHRAPVVLPHVAAGRGPLGAPRALRGTFFGVLFRSPQTPSRRDPLQKTQAKRGDKAKQALAPALKFKAVDEKAFDKLARNVERLAAGSVATTEWARAEGGGAAAPLAEVAELASPPAGEDEYGHEVVDVANGAAAAAFLAAGHGVIDVAAMLGLRVDAHPGSTAGGTDGLHFCMPGPLDYALDLVLSRVGSAFDSVVPEIDRFGGAK